MKKNRVPMGAQAVPSGPSGPCFQMLAETPVRNRHEAVFVILTHFGPVWRGNVPMLQSPHTVGSHTPNCKNTFRFSIFLASFGTAESNFKKDLFELFPARGPTQLGGQAQTIPKLGQGGGQREGRMPQLGSRCVQPCKSALGIAKRAT